MESDLERNVRNYFESVGYAVERVAERRNEETPDYIARRSDETVIVEVKSRDSDRDANEAAQLTDAGRNPVMLRTRTVAGTATAAARFHKAAAQIESRRCQGSVHLVWYDTTGFDADLDQIQASNALCGTAYFTANGDDELYCCHFARRSTFQELRQTIDGVVMSSGDYLYLLLNPLSERENALRNTHFARSLGEAVRRPTDSGQSPHILWLDPDVGVQHHHASVTTEERLFQKYGRVFMELPPLQRYGGVMTLKGITS